MRSVARKQSEQQAVRGRVGEHDAVGRIAVLANEIEERRKISWKQQWAPQFCPDSSLANASAYPFSVRYWGTTRASRGFVAMTQSGHRGVMPHIDMGQLTAPALI